MLVPDAPLPCYERGAPTAARIVTALRSAHVPTDHERDVAQQYESEYRVECETAVWGEAENVTELEPELAGAWCSFISCITTVA